MIDRKIKYVNKFYNNFGWEKKDRNTLDATLFEDLRYNSKEYVSKCRKRLKNYRLIFCILQKLKKHGLHFLQANYEFNPSS